MTKKVSESYIETNQLALPGDTNLLGNLLGGKTMHWIDIAGALTASRHANSKVATISIDKIIFKKPIRQGELVCMKSSLVWAGRTSMVIDVDVYAENLATGERRKTTESRLTFVALDDNEKPTPVPGLQLETEEQKAKFDEVQRYMDQLKKNKNA